MTGRDVAAVFHLAHLSLDTFLPLEDSEADATSLLKLDPHLAVFTEAGQDETVAALEAVAARRHYQLVNPDGGDIAFALRDDLPLLGSGGEKTAPAEKRHAGHVGHGPRFNSWIRFELAGETITHSATHVLTGLGDDKARTREVLSQVELLASQIADNGDGHALSTGSADLNGQLPENARLQEIFDRHQLTTTAAEADVSTPTHGDRRIDYIWTFDRDRRLSVRNYLVHRGPRFKSDHDPLEAWLSIRRRAA